MRTSTSAIQILLVLVAIFSIGCSDGGDNNTPDGGDGGVVDAAPDAPNPVVDGGPDGDVDAGDGGGGCTPTTTDAGCFVCPQETIQFLNQCNSGYCSAFNNNTRITYPGYTPGGPYPAIP